MYISFPDILVVSEDLFRRGRTKDINKSVSMPSLFGENFSS